VISPMVIRKVPSLELIKLASKKLFNRGDRIRPPAMINVNLDIPFNVILKLPLDKIHVISSMIYNALRKLLIWSAAEN
jgi:hypothetical protein